MKTALDWMSAARCRDTNPELFFPVVGGDVDNPTVRQAKKICHSCPVKDACLSFAISTSQRDGIWGGTTEGERRGIRARRIVRGYRSQERPNTVGIRG